MRSRAAYCYGNTTIVGVCFILWNIQWTQYMQQIRKLPDILRPVFQEDDNMPDELIDSLIGVLNQHSVFYDTFWLSGYLETREALRKNVTGAKYLFTETTSSQSNGPSNWEYFVRNINDHYLYDWSDSNIDGLLKDMSTLNITSVEENLAGSKFKLIISFNHQLKANSRPMRYSRETESNPNFHVTEDTDRHNAETSAFHVDRDSNETEPDHNKFERHNAEIAAFHLDRLLGFCRVPPTTGRRLNLNELKRFLPRQMLATFFKSQAGNTCFWGSCRTNCNKKFAVCGQGEILEFSLMMFLPKVMSIRNPYKLDRYSAKALEWETDNTYCEKVKQMKPYDKPHLLLDLIDTHVFDFLIGHQSRHDLYYFKKIGESQIILIDNGRGFGYNGTDFKRLLAPIQQCCRIRKSTLLKLIKLYRGPEKLSVLLEVSLQVDPISPILTSGHLQALDRRVVQVLKTVARCIIDKGLSVNTVIYEDI